MKIEVDLGTLGIALLVCWALIFGYNLLIPSPEDPPPPTEAYEEIIEGVVVRLIPGPDDTTTVVFDDGREYTLALGPHEVYLDEWNQFRVNDSFYVQESYLGEGTIQDMARQ